MKSGKATGTFEVSVEMIVANGKIAVKVMMELCHRVLDGRGMPAEWKTSVIVSIFKGKGDVMSWIIPRCETAGACHENCCKSARETNTCTSQFE